MTNDLRDRCKAISQQLQRDAMLRQNSPVDTLTAFVTAELEAAAAPSREAELVRRPDWKAIYEDCAHEDDDHAHDNDLMTVTRETVELASHALRKQNQADFYHNYGAAERELMDVLHATPDAGREEAK